MKTFFIVFFFTLYLNSVHAQQSEAPYRLFGEVTTVENTQYRGFITWGEIKNYWIDFFEAVKIRNPYSRYFINGDRGQGYKVGGEFATPIHLFCCRFGNISSIRLTGENKIQLTLKNGETQTLVKGATSDINTSLQITTKDGSKHLKWDHISEIHFMAADSTIIPTELNQVAGIVKSPQGLYKGLITWNCNKKRNIEKNHSINLFLNKMSKIVKDKNVFKVLPKENLFNNPVALKNDALYPVEDIMINMPNIGSVIVPAFRFEELEIIPLSDLNLLTYDDFTTPKPIQGTVTTNTHEQITGELAYDLDENLNIEVLDGKNNNISYRIPFKYISKIEPKNYKYSFITLQNGSQISLGDTPDVNQHNGGIIIFNSNKIPTYVVWEIVKEVILEP